MLKNKKRFAVILSLVMLLAMACGAWAADAVVSADGVAKTKTGDVSATGDGVFGLWALKGGSIVYSGGTISTNGANGYGGYAAGKSYLSVDGEIITRGYHNAAHGLIIEASSADMTGNIDVESNLSYGIIAYSTFAGGVAQPSHVTMTGDVLVKGAQAGGIRARYEGTKIVMNGNVEINIPEGAEQDVRGFAVYASNNADIVITGNVTADGEQAYGILAAIESTVKMVDGVLTLSDSESAWNMWVSGGSSIDVDNVTIDNGCANLLKTDDSGTVTATGESNLTGDVLHDGTNAGTLEIILSDGTVINGAVNAVGDGVIEITLEESAWNVTGDSTTNGRITSDSDSNIDFNGTDETITVDIDSLGGDPGISMKVGDKLIIRNADDDTITSSNPEVIDVVKNADGSIEIISKGDGEATLTYKYLDENNKIQTATVTVVSGAGSQPYSGGGGGSSNCNAGMGFSALFGLLGLALIQKRK